MEALSYYNENDEARTFNKLLHELMADNDTVGAIELSVRYADPLCPILDTDEVLGLLLGGYAAAPHEISQRRWLRVARGFAAAQGEDGAHLKQNFDTLIRQLHTAS